MTLKPPINKISSRFPFNQDPIEPIYKTLFEVSFDIDKTDSDVLSNSVTKMTNNIITFNSNIDKTNNFIIPFTNISRHLDKKFNVTVSYHDRQGEVLFQFILINFEFKQFLNLIDIEYSANDIQKLDVAFTFEKIQHINYVGKKNQRRNKIVNIFDDAEYKNIIDGKFLFGEY